MLTLQAGLSGALVGGLFALMALGMSLMWGFLKIINLAHFGMIVLGGYLTFELATNTGMGPVTTVLITAPLLFLAGAAIQWLFEKTRITEFNSLLVSFGMLIIIVQVISNVWSADFQRMDSTVNAYATEAVSIGSLVFPLPTLLASGAAIALVVVAHLVLTRTYAGKALQAFGQDRQIASAFGIDHRLLGILLAGAAGASAAVAGMLFALGNSLTPDTPFEWVGIVFAIVILGGIGNVVGTLYAGMLVGMVSGVVAVVWNPSTSPLVVFSVVVLALLFRPNGLFPQKAAGKGRGWIAVVSIAVALFLMPWMRGVFDFPIFYLVFLGTVLFWTAQATSWNILSGFSGYFSFGQGAFYGVGVYTLAVLVGRHGLNWLLAIVLGGVGAMVLGLGIGAIAFRLRSLRGEIFALLTLAVPFILASIARISEAVDGGQGVVVSVPDYPTFMGPFQEFIYLLSAAVAVLALAVAYGMQRSRYGWALFAIRDDEEVARDSVWPPSITR